MALTINSITISNLITHLTRNQKEKLTFDNDGGGSVEWLIMKAPVSCNDNTFTTEWDVAGGNSSTLDTDSIILEISGTYKIKITYTSVSGVVNTYVVTIDAVDLRMKSNSPFPGESNEADSLDGWSRKVEKQLQVINQSSGNIETIGYYTSGSLVVGDLVCLEDVKEVKQSGFIYKYIKVADYTRENGIVGVVVEVFQDAGNIEYDGNKYYRVLFKGSHIVDSFYTFVDGDSFYYNDTSESITNAPTDYYVGKYITSDDSQNVVIIENVILKNMTPTDDIIFRTTGATILPKTAYLLYDFLIGSSTIGATDIDKKLYFDVSKASLECGTFQDVSSIGDFCLNFGYLNEILSDYSYTLGKENTINGLYSFALGYNNNSLANFTLSLGASNTINNSGAGSVVFGSNNDINGSYSLIQGAFHTVDGANSIVSGYNNTTSAQGSYSGVFGMNNILTRQYSLICGKNNNISGDYSFISGENNNIGGTHSTTIGKNNIVNGDYSFASGEDNSIISTHSHAEGYNNTIEITATYSHVEGNLNTISGQACHAEGYNNEASRDYSHAEGESTIASGLHSHSEGKETLASSSGSHAEGRNTTASGLYSHSENYKNIASGDYSHVEGFGNIANSIGSHAEGGNNIASGGNSHAEGGNNIASGSASHAGGSNTVASGNYSFTSGIDTEASGRASFAIGELTLASGFASFAEGYNTIASGNQSHAEGLFSISESLYSHAEGYESLARYQASHAFANGKFSNIGDAQGERLCGKVITTEDNTVVLFSLPIPNYALFGVKGYIVSKKEGLIDAKYGFYEIDFITRSTGFSLTIGTPNTTLLHSSLAFPGDVTITVDGLNVKINVNSGEMANYAWVGTLYLTEVIY